MSKEAAFCKIILDTNDIVTDWICRGLNFSKTDLGEHITLGFILDNKLIGGLVYHQIRPQRDIWWTIYTTDKRWCNRRVLKAIFGLAFNFWQVERISILVNPDNQSCLKLIKKLGFRQEGLLRKYRDDGSDCLLYGILKSENKWKEINNE